MSIRPYGKTGWTRWSASLRGVCQYAPTGKKGEAEASHYDRADTRVRPYSRAGARPAPTE